jgi:hypothetical protein
MTKVIIHTNENGGVSVTYPTEDFLQTNTIEDVLAKDCPNHAIIVDSSEIPESLEFINAWELINGKVVINEVKKQAIINAQQETKNAKTTAVDKLKTLGLTDAEIATLKGAA